MAWFGVGVGGHFEVLVENLPPWTTESNIRSMFDLGGEISKVRLEPSLTGNTSARIVFTQRSGADNVITNFNGRTVSGYQLDVKMVASRPSSRKGFPPAGVPPQGPRWRCPDPNCQKYNGNNVQHCTKCGYNRHLLNQTNPGPSNGALEEVLAQGFAAMKMSRTERIRVFLTCVMDSTGFFARNEAKSNAWKDFCVRVNRAAVQAPVLLEDTFKSSQTDARTIYLMQRTDETFCRVTISDATQRDRVHVLLTDYGSKDFVPLSRLRLAPQDISAIPPFVEKYRLLYVKIGAQPSRRAKEVLSQYLNQLKPPFEIIRTLQRTSNFYPVEIRLAGTNHGLLSSTVSLEMFRKGLVIADAEAESLAANKPPLPSTDPFPKSIGRGSNISLNLRGMPGIDCSGPPTSGRGRGLPQSSGISYAMPFPDSRYVQAPGMTNSFNNHADMTHNMEKRIADLQREKEELLREKMALENKKPDRSMEDRFKFLQPLLQKIYSLQRLYASESSLLSVVERTIVLLNAPKWYSSELDSALERVNDAETTANSVAQPILEYGKGEMVFDEMQKEIRLQQLHRTREDLIEADEAFLKIASQSPISDFVSEVHSLMEELMLLRDRDAADNLYRSVKPMNEKELEKAVKSLQRLRNNCQKKTSAQVEELNCLRAAVSGHLANVSAFLADINAPAPSFNAYSTAEQGLNRMEVLCQMIETGFADAERQQSPDLMYTVLSHLMTGLDCRLAELRRLDSFQRRSEERVKDFKTHSPEDIEHLTREVSLAKKQRRELQSQLEHLLVDSRRAVDDDEDVDPARRDKIEVEIKEVRKELQGWIKREEDARTTLGRLATVLYPELTLESNDVSYKVLMLPDRSLLRPRREIAIYDILQRVRDRHYYATFCGNTVSLAGYLISHNKDEFMKAAEKYRTVVQNRKEFVPINALFNVCVNDTNVMYVETSLYEMTLEKWVLECSNDEPTVETKLEILRSVIRAVSLLHANKIYSGRVHPRFIFLGFSPSAVETVTTRLGVPNFAYDADTRTKKQLSSCAGVSFVADEETLPVGLRTPAMRDVFALKGLIRFLAGSGPDRALKRDHPWMGWLMTHSGPVSLTSIRREFLPRSETDISPRVDAYLKCVEEEQRLQQAQQEEMDRAEYISSSGSFSDEEGTASDAESLHHLEKPEETPKLSACLLPPAQVVEMQSSGMESDCEDNAVESDAPKAEKMAPGTADDPLLFSPLPPASNPPNPPESVLELMADLESISSLEEKNFHQLDEGSLDSSQQVGDENHQSQDDSHPSDDENHQSQDDSHPSDDENHQSQDDSYQPIANHRSCSQTEGKDVKLDDDDKVNQSVGNYCQAEDKTLELQDEKYKLEDKTIKPEDKTIKPEDKTIKPEDKTIKPEEKIIKPEEKKQKTQDKGDQVDTNGLQAREEEISEVD